MTSNPLQELSEAEVADALSLAIVSGALGSSKGSTLSTTEAFAVATQHSDAVAQSAIGLVAASGSPHDPAFSQRVHLGVVVGSAVVSGLVAQNALPAEALAQFDAMRSRIVGIAQGLSGQPNAEVSAKFLAGTLRGEVLSGSTPTQALDALETRSVEFAAAALELTGLVLPPQAFGAADVGGDIAQTAVAGLMGQGMSASDALGTVRQYAPEVVAAAQALTQASVVSLPSAGAWRDQRQSPAQAPSGPASPKGVTPR